MSSMCSVLTCSWASLSSSSLGEHRPFRQLDYLPDLAGHMLARNVPPQRVPAHVVGTPHDSLRRAGERRQLYVVAFGVVTDRTQGHLSIV